MMQTFFALLRFTATLIGFAGMMFGIAALCLIIA